VAVKQVRYSPRPAHSHASKSDTGSKGRLPAGAVIETREAYLVAPGWEAPAIRIQKDKDAAIAAHDRILKDNNRNALAIYFYTDGSGINGNKWSGCSMPGSRCQAAGGHGLGQGVHGVCRRAHGHRHGPYNHIREKATAVPGLRLINIFIDK